MGDKGKILFGLAIFVILITFPFWGRLAAGDALPGRGGRAGLRGLRTCRRPLPRGPRAAPSNAGGADLVLTPDARQRRARGGPSRGHWKGAPGMKRPEPAVESTRPSS